MTEQKINLYEEYGKAMVDLEIVQNKVNRLKEMIQIRLNAPTNKVVTPEVVSNKQKGGITAKKVEVKDDKSI